MSRTQILDSFDRKLKALFGSKATSTPLQPEGSFGRRLHHLDLTQRLSPDQAELLVAALDHFSLLTFPKQGDGDFALRHLERLANHFGAPLPHPKNYGNYAQHVRHKVPLELLAKDKQTATLSNRAFPGTLQCVADASSPAVYVVTNLPGSGTGAAEQLASGLHWHTDVEFEPIPLSTSMFYVQSVPTRRDAPNSSWVPNVVPEPGFYHPDSSTTLMERRLKLPLNGETAFADTVGAFADLPPAKQEALEQVMLRRRLRPEDEGWLIPLVYENPRTGQRSLHSPIWASRGKNIAPVEVDGLGEEESRAFLDALEEHVLSPKYRYDHEHAPGDVTIWSNFATLHNAPPAKSIISDPRDARLMYRISCKGEPSFTLPRTDSEPWLKANIRPPYRTPSNFL